jgi:hypothetical protein
MLGFRIGRSCAVILASIGLSGGLRADFVFHTDAAEFALGEDGSAKRLVDKTGRNLLDGENTPFATIEKSGKTFAASAVTQEGDLLHVSFGASQVQVDFQVIEHARYFTIKVAHLEGKGIEAVHLAQLRIKPMPHAGSWFAVQWSDEVAVAMLGLSDRVNTTASNNAMLTAAVYAEFGIEGQGVAIVPVPTSLFLEVVQEIEQDAGLPSPKLDGEWAKTSEDARESYLFTDLSERNVDEAIRYAKLAGFGYILITESTWSTSFGSYPINLKNFPGEEISLKAVVEKCHRAGLKVGMHMVTSIVSKADPLVRPRPDLRLLKDAEAIVAHDVGLHSNEISAMGSLAAFPTTAAEYGNAKAGLDIQIDDEIIHYGTLAAAKATFINCARGYSGTQAAPHRAGAKIFHLAERYNSYLADLKTSLKNEISKRVAGVVNRCGFDMIYFDGGENNIANGPYWYWVSQQQQDICHRLTRPVLAQGSGWTQWTWHWFARSACDDYAAVAPKQWLEYHKIPLAKSLQNNFLPPELGWWGFLAEKPDHPATSPDEVEYYATRMLALDMPVSLETTVDALKQNGRTEEMLKLIGRYEQLRLGRKVPPETRDKLRQGEWHMTDGEGAVHFEPIHYQATRLAIPGAAHIQNRFGPQMLKFRLQCVPTLAKAGDGKNIVLLDAASPVELQAPLASAQMPGALCRRVELTHGLAAQKSLPLDLTHHRGLAIRLRVEGNALSMTPEAVPVLNLQLESDRKRYRDYYVDLNFTGERTIIVAEPTTERMLAEFPPKAANYAFKMATYDFDYGKVAALNLRWMRAPAQQTPRCYVTRIEALSESDVFLQNPTITIGDTTLSIPAELHSGDYAEFWANDSVSIFDRNGVRLSTLKPSGAVPTLESGDGEILVRGLKPASVVLTTITAGDPIP